MSYLEAPRRSTKKSISLEAPRRSLLVKVVIN
jgi:hypothetical protein